ncbi:hypothetical protein FB451DRAFT_1163906 [Mycena latifolia]|nr:hypothetical protein FB451DRAFT_1163906 [Mycena latifolia]
MLWQLQPGVVGGVQIGSAVQLQGVLLPATSVQRELKRTAYYSERNVGAYSVLYNIESRIREPSAGEREGDDVTVILLSHMPSPASPVVPEEVTCRIAALFGAVLGLAVVEDVGTDFQDAVIIQNDVHPRKCIRRDGGEKIPASRIGSFNLREQGSERKNIKKEGGVHVGTKNAECEPENIPRLIENPMKGKETAKEKDSLDEPNHVHLRIQER